MSAGVVFEKPCGQFRVGSEAAEKLAKEIGGYVMFDRSKQEYWAANRAALLAVPSRFDGDEWIISATPEDLARVPA